MAERRYTVTGISFDVQTVTENRRTVTVCLWTDHANDLDEVFAAYCREWPPLGYNTMRGASCSDASTPARHGVTVTRSRSCD